MTGKVECILALALLLGCGLSAQAGEVWRVASLEWLPYAGEKAQAQGQAIDKLRRILAADGIELEVAFYPWSRAQRKATEPAFVGYFPAWPEEVRAGFVASAPVDESMLGVMSYAGSDIRWHNLEQLFKNQVVGMVRTYVYPAEIQALIDKYPGNVRFTSDELVLAKVLSRRRIDVALTDPRVMTHYAKQERITNIITLHGRVARKALVFSFRDSPDNQARINRFKALMAKD